MKKFLIPALALLVSHASVNAQQNLTLVIDQDAQTFDWLAGTSISTEGSLANNWFGAPLFPNATITSPQLSLTGDGSYLSTQFQISGDRLRIEGVNLGTSLPALGATTLAGTAEGPMIATFTQGNFAMFNQLTKGEYTLAPMFGNWSGGIHVVIVPEPSTWALMGFGLGAIALARTRRSTGAAGRSSEVLASREASRRARGAI